MKDLGYGSITCTGAEILCGAGVLMMTRVQHTPISLF